MSNKNEPTKEQQRIIDDDGNVAVIANPGSGKTFTIVEKIKKISEQLLSYQGVVAISFTNKASEELRLRCRSQGISIKQSFFGTIDKFYINQIIIPFARHITHNLPEFDIRNDMKDDPKYHVLKSIKTSDEFDEQLLTESLSEGIVFLDICAETAKYILKKVPDVIIYLKSKYTHIFIDEYQDCGAVQHEIFMSMVAAGIKGIAVGDVNQAIYAFSDRYPEYLISLTKDSNFTTYPITRNHRCHSSISKYSLALMGGNAGDIEKEKRVFLVSYNGDEESAAKHFNEKIDKICEKYSVIEKRQIAVLCRGKSTIERIAQAMTLPYKLYLETPLDTHNSIWARFFVDLLTSYFDKNVFCTDFTEKYFFEDVFPKQYKSFLNKSKELFDTEESRLINKVTLMIQMAKLAYPNNENAEAIELLNNVLQDVEMLHNFAPAAPDQVVLMTYHKSKGLEFDIVFNMDVYEYIMPPFKRSEQTDKEYWTDYIQTLNLHYVGITRAKQVCYIMQGTVRHNSNGEVKRGVPSQFLNLNGVNNMRNNVSW